MSDLSSIQGDLAAISAKVDLIVTMIANLRATGQGVVSQADLDALGASIAAIKAKTDAIS